MDNSDTKQINEQINEQVKEQVKEPVKPKTKSRLEGLRGALTAQGGQRSMGADGSRFGGDRRM